MISPAKTGWLDKRYCASSYCKHVQLYMEYMSMFDRYLDALLLICIMLCVMTITWSILYMQLPFIRPYAYGVFNPAAYYLYLLSLLHCKYCYYFTYVVIISLLLQINCVKQFSL